MRRLLMAGLCMLPVLAATTASAARLPNSVTLAVDHQDLVYGQSAMLTGRVDPPPEPGREAAVRIGSEVPGVQYSDDIAGDPPVNPDGTFQLKVRPETNRQYTAGFYYRDSSADPAVSAPLVVYVDYGLETFWRHRRGNVIEAAMRIKAPAGAGLDYLDRRRVYFYAFRRRTARFARLVARPRIFYTNDTSGGHAAAYFKRRVRAGRRIRYMFACLPNKHPLVWGRPDDPFQVRCGHRRFALS